MNSDEFVSRKEIMDLARQLGEALARSKELYEYREAERQVASDPEACRLTRVFKQKHAELLEMQKDENCSKEDLERCAAELDAADRDMKSNPHILAYYNKGSMFNSLIYQINQVFKFYTTDNEDSIQFKKAGCSNCSGCGHR